MRRLDSLWLEITRARSARAACGVLVRTLSEVLHGGVAILRHESGAWNVEDWSEPAGGPFERLGIAGAVAEATQSVPVAPLGTVGTAQWTGVPIGEHDPPGTWLLILPGSPHVWRAAPWFESFVRHVSLALQLTGSGDVLREREHLVRRLHVFACRLARSSNRGLHQLIVDNVAKAVGARIGSLAMYAPEDDALRITATHGYPAVVVQHVRASAGVGVLGSVFASRKPLLVADIAPSPGRPRPRYRTRSFMAVPLVTGDTGLGVVTVTDRIDGRPFGRREFATARSLATPAVLALACERMMLRAADLGRMTSIDPLTGLTNRREFQSRLEEELERARRHSLDLALLMLDIDGFKAFNDSLGHLAGDMVIQSVAKVLQRAVRKFDVCARYGGDEFAIMTPASDAARALQSAERIRGRISMFQTESGLAADAPRLTASIGVAVAVNGVSTSLQLITQADRALYRAKADGRDCVRVAETDVDLH